MVPRILKVRVECSCNGLYHWLRLRQTGVPLPLDSFAAHLWYICFSGFSRQIYASWNTCSRRSLHFHGGWVCLEGRSEIFRGMSFLVSLDRQLWFFKHGLYIFSHLFDDYTKNVCIHSYASLKLLHSPPSRFHRQLTSIVIRISHTWHLSGWNLASLV